MTDTSTTSVKAAAAAITSVTLEVPDPAAARAFYRAAFGLGTQVRLRASHAPATGFRGFTLSLVVSQPSTVGSFTDPDSFAWEAASRESETAGVVEGMHHG